MQTLVIIVTTLALHAGQITNPERAVLFPLHIADAVGNTHTITIGVHPDATEGYDISLGEIPVPSVPFENMFDARFVDSPERAELATSGSYLDLRKLHSATQLDTFRVSLRTFDEHYPIVISWGDPLEVSTSMMLIGENHPETTAVDMSSVSSRVVADATTTRVLIVVRGMGSPLR